MCGFNTSVFSRFVSLSILLAVVVTTAAPQCKAASLFSLGAGQTRFKESQVLVWDHSWYLTGACFFDVRPHLQLGLSASYCFLQARPPNDLFGIGVFWEEPVGDGWMFSLLPAVRVPFPLGEDGSTQVYLQGGAGWYHLNMEVIYTGSSMPEPDGEEIEKRVTAKWDKPGIEGRFGVITRLDKTLFLEISPGISVIFTDEESSWSLSGFMALALML